ncbi:MAG: hypothetical protein ACI8UO_000863 [Verrucomicrobiales bacterium]|jgi:hypothetical protein
MKRIISTLSLFLAASRCCWAQAEDSAQVDSIGLFKNGLAVVRVIDEIPKSGKLEISALPDPVHGTFWVLSENDVTARLALQDIAAPLATVSKVELLQNLAGKTVTVHLKDDTITGEVLGQTPEQRKKWNRDYATTNGNRWGWYGGREDTSTQAEPSLTFIKTEDGKIVTLQPDKIERVEFGELPAIKRERPVLLLESAEAGEVHVEYLTKGMSWAPSYRIDISDEEILTIAQKTVIRNELADLRDVEIRLISGFPSVRFGGVDSPMSARQTWTNFFQQLAGAASNGGGNALSNGVLSQQIAFNRVAPQVGAGAALGPADEGESVDLHYQNIGRHSLAPGESLALDVADGKAEYERVVEWNIPDTRAPNGRYIEDYQRQQNPEKFDDSAWDAIVFANPFDFPMTTAPAMLVHDGKFQGQQTSTWTNPGSETSIRITKALSVATRTTEHEIPDTRENLRIAGNDYYKVQVQGELTMKNHRGKPATLAIKRQFSGELLESEDDPDQQLLEVGVYSINKRNELKWRIELKPGEEKFIKYRYQVLVDN